MIHYEEAWLHSFRTLTLDIRSCWWRIREDRKEEDEEEAPYHPYDHNNYDHHSRECEAFDWRRSTEIWLDHAEEVIVRILYMRKALQLQGLFRFRHLSRIGRSAGLFAGAILYAHAVDPLIEEREIGALLARQ